MRSRGNVCPGGLRGGAVQRKELFAQWHAIREERTITIAATLSRKDAALRRRIRCVSENIVPGLSRIAGIVLGIAAFTGATGGLAASTTFDAAGDYSGLDNPHVPLGKPDGQWSYGYAYSIGGVFTLDEKVFNSGSQDGYQWTGSNGVHVWRNVTGTNVTGVGNGDVSLHPGDGGEYSVLRWTALAPGVVDVRGQFGAGYYGTEDYLIAVNGSLVFSRLGQGSDQPFVLAGLSVGPGTVIDFVVRGDYSGGDTPLTGSIALTTAVPEPQSYTMLFAGLGLLGLRASRGRRWAR